MALKTQLELLKEQLEKARARGGSPDNAFVKGLEARIAKLQKPRADNPIAQTRLSAGMRSALTARRERQP